MPIWYRNRPPELTNPTELCVAEVLDHLSKDWHICWGYYYQNDIDAQNAREGDFIILGPRGQILVLEVKSGQNRQFLITGRWEGSHDGDNPLEQLNAEWKEVLKKVQLESDFNSDPYVARALCMPNLNRTGIERLAPQFGQALLVTQKELETFESWWREHIEKHENRCPKPILVFQKAIVPHLKPAAPDIFIKETDRLFDRYRSSESEFLEMLNENRQWIVEGGPGTGKTFLALQRAQQLAETQLPGGARVLFLCYNLILADQLTQIVSQLKLKRGSIEVKSWQALIEDILGRADLHLDPPTERDALFRYYEEEIPEYVCTILKEKPPIPQYDALIVDEAQDHDTVFLGSQHNNPLGWWSWYFALIKDGLKAPIALFLDLAQRPSFRETSRFSLQHLRDGLPTATHVRLRRVLRYTRQVHGYLATLPFQIAKDFSHLALPAEGLPEGPEVLEVKAGSYGLVRTIEDVIRKWTSSPQRHCRVDDIVIMGFNKSLSNSWSLKDVQAIGGHPLVDYAYGGQRGLLRYIGIHRAKGLDFLGVILVDLPLPIQLAETEDTDRQETYFLGATRARQLLAVIST